MLTRVEIVNPRYHTITLITHYINKGGSITLENLKNSTKMQATSLSNISCFCFLITQTPTPAKTSTGGL